MKICCVIVNYNDSETVEKLLLKIRGYDSLSHIVIVDNASTDGSYERLRKLSDPRAAVISSGRNGGYGAGNNFGIRYAAEHFGATHVVIANPDVFFTERCIRTLAEVFVRYPEAGAATARMEDPQFAGFPNAWRLHGFLGELLFMGPVCRRIFRDILYYPASALREKRPMWVDVVQGSMLMVSADAFLSCGGYDERVFLYQEEMILARRLKAAGRRTALVPSESYFHQHSASIGKSFSGQLTRQRLREQSVLFYMENYLGIGPIRKAAAKAWFAVIRAEIRIYGSLRKHFLRG